jgi:hypothetical protein
VTRQADQIALPLDWPQAQDASRFILSEANRAAFRPFSKLEPVAGQGDDADWSKTVGPIAACPCIRCSCRGAFV